jgi:CRP-like cAMP-binding protein
MDMGEGVGMLVMMMDTALFNGVSRAHMEAISRFTTVVAYPEGAPVIIEGDATQHCDLLLLVEGEVDVGARYSPLPNAMQFNLHAISNELFGEVSLILGRSPTASVKCRKPCKFLRIDGGEFFAYCRAHPDVGMELITRVAAVLARRLVHLTELMRDKDLFT